ncbi:hypothetical protein HPB51_023619 [Rhipicephalus microplus]|uniref:Uncharacterized protein n=1 Tax=Rhipicephalus microplus TaxID=6941 RepID=A0A9J6DD82_RHIMP|nr:hypothetical protein HPB51_023619 [Rhipicephalus microplus]
MELLVLRDVKIRFEYLGVWVKRVRVLGFRADGNDMALQQGLGNYRKVLELRFEHVPDFEGVLNSIRVVCLQIATTVFNLIQLSNIVIQSCKAQTRSSAAPPVASSCSHWQVSGVADGQEAAPKDAEGYTLPQPEPIGEGALGGEKREAGLELTELPTFPAASSAGAPVTNLADAPAVEEEDGDTMDCSLVLR